MSSTGHGAASAAPKQQPIIDFFMIQKLGHTGASKQRVLAIRDDVIAFLSPPAVTSLTHTAVASLTLKRIIAIPQILSLTSYENGKQLRILVRNEHDVVIWKDSSSGGGPVEDIVNLLLKVTRQGGNPVHYCKDADSIDLKSTHLTKFDNYLNVAKRCEIRRARSKMTAPIGPPTLSTWDAIGSPLPFALDHAKMHPSFQRTFQGLHVVMLGAVLVHSSTTSGPPVTRVLAFTPNSVIVCDEESGKELLSCCLFSLTKLALDSVAKSVTMFFSNEAVPLLRFSFAPKTNASGEHVTDDAGVVGNVIKFLLAREGVDCVVEALQQAFPTPPNPVVVANNAGCVSPSAEQLKSKGNELMGLAMYKEAIECYAKAIELEPTNHILYANRAAAHLHSKDYRSSIVDCEKAISIDKTYSQAFSRLGCAHFYEENYPRAVDAYTKALELQPDSESYKADLRRAEERLKASGNAAAGSHGGDANPETARTESSAVDSVPGADPPPVRCFKRSPALCFGDAIRALFTVPPPDGRKDLDLPDEDDAECLVNHVEMSLLAVLKRPSVKDLRVSCGLTDDEVRMLIAYKLEQPYKLYKWLNALLTCNRRDDVIVAKVGPAFTLLYRALEKLPQRTVSASRSIRVGQIPTLQKAYAEYRVRFAVGEAVNFWGFSSFSTNDDVTNNEAFIGKPGEPAITFTCGALTGVDMEPFGFIAESEILPLAPALFVVTAVTRVGSKVVATLEQKPHALASYVVPAKKS